MMKETLKCQYRVGSEIMRGYAAIKAIGPRAFNGSDGVCHYEWCDRPHTEVTHRPGDWSFGIGRDPFDAGTPASLPF